MKKLIQLLIATLMVACTSAPKTSLLMKAAEEGDTAALQSLLATGADVNAKDDESGMTALMWATGASTDAVDVLLAAGADVEARNDRGATALMAAAAVGHIANVERLLAAGADLEAQGGGGGTALMTAALLGRTAIVDVLLAAGADLEARSNGGATALMDASAYGSTATVERLLEAGADVNARTDRGATALMMTGSSVNQAIVQLLLEAGADANDRGRIAWMPNASDGSPDLLRFFREGVVAIKEPHEDDPAPGKVETQAIYECVAQKHAANSLQLDTWLKECMQQLTELRPGVLVSYRTRGNHSYDRGNYREAIADYTRAIELNPRDRQALEKRAAAYEELGMNEEAVADRQRAIELR